jgi:hypothetical protein
MNGQVEVLAWIKEQAPNQWNQWAQNQSFLGFQMAALNGHLDVLQWYKDNVTEAGWKAMVSSNHYAVFSYAAKQGNVDVMQWLKHHSPKDVWLEMVAADDYLGFRWACQFGHLKALHWFEANVKEEVSNMIAASNHGAIQKAHEHQQADVLSWLLHYKAANRTNLGLFARSKKEPHEDARQHSLSETMLIN